MMTFMRSRIVNVINFDEFFIDSLRESEMISTDVCYLLLACKEAEETEK